MLEKLIAKLSQELGMEDLVKMTENHHYLIPFEGDIEIEARETENNYFLKGKIGPSPEQNTEAFLQRLMEANLFGIGTRGAAIGLSEDGKLLTLSRQLDYNSTFDEFKEKLEDFVNVLEFWRKEALKHE